MQFTTPIQDFGRTFPIGADAKLLALGSCFAEVVGRRMGDRRLDILLNPTGVLYNPRSLFNLLDIAGAVARGDADALSLAAPTVFQAPDGRWYSWLASSLISGATCEECVDRLADALQQTALRLSQMDILMLTFGTDHYYALDAACAANPNLFSKGSMVAVANCHKMPARMFREHIMDTTEIVTLFDHQLRQLLELRPQLRVIVSVSPYRYLKYGLHGNQLSKANLLLATERIAQTFSEVSYFPAYEILLDELRDYRYFAPDMVHPSEVAEDYIWQLFCSHYMSDSMQQTMKERERELRALRHRPLIRPES
ncbi:MAG: GSCFA domain-containing protein [Bacteroidaceae bacterium]|nr:GSCFA domain-containing protein [Bacteroidaceae bacterium]